MWTGIVEWLGLSPAPQHLRVVGCEAGGVGPVGQPVLEPALHHVVVVQPRVGLHHLSLCRTRITRISGIAT